MLKVKKGSNSLPKKATFTYIFTSHPTEQNWAEMLLHDIKYIIISTQRRTNPSLSLGKLCLSTCTQRLQPLEFQDLWYWVMCISPWHHASLKAPTIQLRLYSWAHKDFCFNRQGQSKQPTTCKICRKLPLDYTICVLSTWQGHVARKRMLCGEYAETHNSSVVTPSEKVAKEAEHHLTVLRDFSWLAFSVWLSKWAGTIFMYSP